MTIDFSYDHLGQRMYRTNGANTTLYLYDIFGNLIEEADMSLNPINTYIYLGNHRVAVVGGAYTGSFGCSISHLKESAKANWAIIILVPLLVFLGLRYRRNRYVVGMLVIVGAGAIILIMAQKAQSTIVYNEGIYYYHNDHLGTPQVITADNGDVVWDAVYEPFGKINTYAVQTFTNNFRFPGQYEDEGTGMYYNHHRYYMPEVGRYNRVDPIQSELQKLYSYLYINDATQSQYYYSKNNPILLSDATGLKCDNCESAYCDGHCDYLRNRCNQEYAGDEGGGFYCYMVYLCCGRKCWTCAKDKNCCDQFWWICEQETKLEKPEKPKKK